MNRTNKQRLFIVSAIVASMLGWAIVTLWLIGTPLSPRVIALAVLLALWAFAPAAWLLLEDIGELKSTRLERYARGLWVAAAITLIITALALMKNRVFALGPGPVNWNIVQEIVRIVIWPMIVLLSLALFREPLAAFFRALGARASKIGAFNVSIELASLPEARAWSGPKLDDLNSQFPFAATDSAAGLFTAIADTTRADYVTVNLEHGKAWLTSRLFILATLIPRVRAIKRIVFLAGPAEEFVGEARPSDVAAMLALKYPWFEDSYMNAQRQAGLEYSPTRPPLPHQPPALLSEFLRQVQINPAPATPPSNEWVLFEGHYAEHAEWLTKDLLSDILKKKLNRSSVKRDPAVNSSTAAQSVLLTDADFVAIVDTFGTFLHLIDRYQALDQGVRNQVSAT